MATATVPQTFTDALAKWSVPILLAVLGFIGTGVLGKVDTLNDKVSDINRQAAATSATLTATQEILRDFKADAEQARQDTKERLADQTMITNAKFDQLTAWVRSLADQIHAKPDSVK